MQPINSNLSAQANRLLALTTTKLTDINRTLATAMRINRGADDPAGLIASEQLRSMLRSLEAESRSMQRADHVAATADAAIGSMSEMLGEAEALAVANANTAGMSAEEKQANQMEIDSILASVNRIAGTTQFNGQPLFNGAVTLRADEEALPLPAVATHLLGETDVDGQAMSLADVGSGQALNTIDGNIEGATAVIGAARTELASLRGEIGAFQKHAIGALQDSLAVTMENVAAAESQIRDTDYAYATAEQSRLLVIQQANLHAARLSQSDARNVLTLLG